MIMALIVLEAILCLLRFKIKIYTALLSLAMKIIGILIVIVLIGGLIYR